MGKYHYIWHSQTTLSVITSMFYIITYNYWQLYMQICSIKTLLKIPPSGECERVLSDGDGVDLLLL